MMKLYLVQHGEAKPKEEDPERPLTDRGTEEVTKVATFLARSGIKVNQIRHSGKRRAEETASILGQNLSPPAGVRAVQGLAPKDGVDPIAEVLQLETNPIMLVGHLPFLNRLASLLLTGDEEKTVVHFRMGGCVCLVKEEEQWSMAWAITPDII